MNGAIARAERLRILRDLAILAGIVTAFFAHILLAGNILMLRDLFNIWTGYQSFFCESWLSGSIPLWEPYSGCGEPFLADPQSASLYPLSFLFLILPKAQAATIAVALHLILAAWGVYLLCRLWRISSAASLMASIAFTFSTMTLGRVEFYAVLTGLAWYPIILAAWVFLLRAPSLPRFMGLVGAMALQVLSGYPENVLYTAATLGLHALCTGIIGYRTTRRWQTFATPMVVVMLAGLLMVLLTTAQLLPTLEAQHLSQRAHMDPELQKASLHPFMLFTLLLPYLYGTLGLAGQYWAPSCYEYWVGAFYIGVMPIIVLLTALWALITGRRPPRQPVPRNAQRKLEQRIRTAWVPFARYWPGPDIVDRATVPFLIALALFFLLYSMGKYTPLFPLLWRAIPLLWGFRWPTKSLMCVALSLACLSGLALDMLVRAADKRRSEVTDNKGRWIQFVPLAFFTTLAVLMVLCLVRQGALGQWFLRTFFNLSAVQPELAHNIEWNILARDCAKLAITGVLGSLTLQVFLLLPRFRVGAGVLMILLLLGDLTITSLPILSAGSAKIVESNGAFLDQVQPKGSSVRFMKDDPLAEFWIYGVRDDAIYHTLRRALMKGWSITDRVRSLPQELTLEPANVNEVLSIFHAGDVPENAKARLLHMLNCKYLLRYPKTSDYIASGKLDEPTVDTLTDPLPRAYVVGGVQVVKERKELLGFLAYAEDFDPLSTVVMDNESTSGHAFYEYGSGRVKHRVNWTEDTPNRLVLDVESEAPGILVVTDTFFPGWRATCNDKSVPIYQVNGAFRGIPIPAGKSTVAMIYRPASFLLGAFISLVTLAPCTIAWIWTGTFKAFNKTQDSSRGQEGMNVC